MKLPLIATLLICGCLSSFRAHAVAFEYDLVGAPAGDTGQIFLDASSNPAGANTDIVSYNITISGNLFDSANSVITNPSFILAWDTSTIDTMDLSLQNTNSGNILSATDSGIVGTGIPPGINNIEWDAASTSVPDTADTLPLFALGLISLGWYYYILILRRQRLARVALKIKR